MKKNNSEKAANRKRIFGMLFFVLLIAVTFFLIFKNENSDEIFKVISEVNLWSIAAGALCMLICVACEGECDRIICKSLGSDISRIKAFTYACTDYYFSAVTPSATGGQPAMAYYMSKDGIPLSKSCIALLLTLIEYMAALLVLGVAAFFLHMDFVCGNTLILVMLCIGVVLGFSVILGSLVAMYSKSIVYRIGEWFIRLMAGLRICRRPKKKLESFKRQVAEYKTGAQYIKEHHGVSVRVFLLCILQRILFFMVTYCVYRGMGLRGSSMIDIITLQALLMLCVTSLPLPGAVGAAEGMFLVIFSQVIPPELITSAMLLTRGINFYFCVIFAGIVTLINHIRILRLERRTQ